MGFFWGSVWCSFLLNVGVMMIFLPCEMLGRHHMQLDEAWKWFLGGWFGIWWTFVGQPFCTLAIGAIGDWCWPRILWVHRGMAEF